jgi:hypothetical protein
MPRKTQQYSITLTDEQIETIEHCFADSATWKDAALSDKIHRLLVIGADKLGHMMPFKPVGHGGRREGAGRKRNS